VHPTGFSDVILRAEPAQMLKTPSAAKSYNDMMQQLEIVQRQRGRGSAKPAARQTDRATPERATPDKIAGRQGPQRESPAPGAGGCFV
jgi:hypothetical protein